MTSKKKKGNPMKGTKTAQRCGYLGCGHHQGHRGPHTWSER